MSTPGYKKIGLQGIVRDRISYQKLIENIMYKKTKGKIGYKNYGDKKKEVKFIYWCLSWKAGKQKYQQKIGL